MRKSAVPVCLLLCLALLPAAALGEMTPCPVEGIPFQVWSDWAPQETGDGSLVFYGTEAAQPFDGYLLITAEDSVYVTDQTPASILGDYAAGIGAELDEGFAAEPTRAGGRDGLFLTGTLLGLFRVDGYLCLSGSRVIAALLVGNIDYNAAALRGMLLEVIGSEGAEAADAGSEERAGSDAWVSGQILGVPYRVPESWREETGADGALYYTRYDSPADGFVMVSAYDFPADVGTVTRDTLDTVLDSFAASLTEDVTVQPADLGGREGIFFSGDLFGMGLMDGYLCHAGDGLAVIIAVDAEADAEALHAMLLEILEEAN